MRVSISIALVLLAAGAGRGDSFMPPDELARGMVGIGKTVFQGTRIDTFQVEILGVARNGIGPQQDMILARLSGGPLEQTGVIRGMSGSPVYVEGRLIGAVAYGWAYAEAPICGITPIAHMLDVLERDLGPPDEQAAGPVRLDPDAAALLRDVVPSAAAMAQACLEPLATPLWVSGVTPAAGTALAELLEPMGLRVLNVPGGDASPAAGPIEPGAPLGAQLVSGDMTVTAIGTVTYVDGDRVAGFGHPMMLSGATDLPMTGAYIHDIIPNQISSFKMGAAGAAVGAIRQDRAPGVGGVLGPPPRLVPVHVRVHAAAAERQFCFGIARSPELVPGLAQAVLLSSLEAGERLFGDATVEMRSSICLQDGRSLVNEQLFAGPAAIAIGARESVGPLGVLVSSPFSSVSLDSIAFDVTVGERIEAASVSAVRAVPATVEAGDTLTVTVVLQPYRRASAEQIVRVAVPDDTPPGPVSLRVGSGGRLASWEQRRRPDAFEPRDTEQLLALLALPARSDELVVELSRNEAGLTLNGRELPALPPSVRSTLETGASGGRFGPVRARVLQRQVLRTPFVLEGEQTVELTVEKDRRP